MVTPRCACWWTSGGRARHEWGSRRRGLVLVAGPGTKAADLASLLEEARATGRVDVARFYARRARRLLPAALTALIGTALLTCAVAAVAMGPVYLMVLRAMRFPELDDALRPLVARVPALGRLLRVG